MTQNASREENDVDQTVVATLNSVIGKNRLNTFRVNFTQEDVAFANPNFNGNGQDQAALMPTLVYTSFVDQQSNVAQARVNDAYQIDDTMSWFISGRGGSHDLKFGGNTSTSVRNRRLRTTERHLLLQDRSELQRRRSADLSRPAADSGARRAEPLSEGALRRGVRAGQMALTNRATLSLGLRYDLEVQPITEVDNPAFSDPSAYPVDKNNIAARLGLTYDLAGDGQSVVRGGYGRFYDKTHFELISAILTAGAFSDSFHVLFPANNFDPGPAAGNLPTDPMLVGGPDRQSRAACRRVSGRQPHQEHRHRHARQPRSRDSLHRPVHRRLRAAAVTTMSVSADYVHARARDQLMLQDLNPGVRTSPARTAPVVRINPAYVAAGEPAGECRRDRLRRAADGPGQTPRVRLLVPRVVHTGPFARQHERAAIPLSGFQLLDDLNLDLNEGPTNVDRRHNLVISGQALVPKTHGLTLAWVVRALSGARLRSSTRRPIPI